MNVGLDHPLDHQAPGGGLFQVYSYVAPRIHDHRATGCLVTHQI
jgi:hypothetical protein